MSGINYFDTPVYVENDDVIQSTENEELQALTDDKMDKLIIKAQYLVDDYIGDYDGEKVDEEQDFIFPVKKYNNPEDHSQGFEDFIPRKVKQATILIVENLFELSLSDGERILSEKVGDQAYTYADDGPADEIPDQAYKILDRIKENYFVVSANNPFETDE